MLNILIELKLSEKFASAFGAAKLMHEKNVNPTRVSRHKPFLSKVRDEWQVTDCRNHRHVATQTESRAWNW